MVNDPDTAITWLRDPACTPERAAAAVAFFDRLLSTAVAEDRPATADADRLRQAVAAYAAARADQDGVQLLRAQHLANPLFDSPDAQVRRYAALSYLAVSRAMDFPTRGRQALDEATGLSRQLLRESRGSADPRVRALRNQTLALLVSALLVRGHRKMELLPYGENEAHAERLRADLDEACLLLDGLEPPADQSVEALTLRGWALTVIWQLQPEDAVLDEAVRHLRLAATRPIPAGLSDLAQRDAETGRAAALDRLAVALMLSGRPGWVHEGEAVLAELHEGVTDPTYRAGALISEATAQAQLWLLKPTPEAAARTWDAYRAAVVGTAGPLPLTAFQAATQWGGWLLSAGRPRAAAMPYAVATLLLPGLVSHEFTDEQREELIRIAPGVAAHAAWGLAGTDPAAAVACLETSRAILHNARLTASAREDR